MGVWFEEVLLVGDWGDVVVHRELRQGVVGVRRTHVVSSRVERRKRAEFGEQQQRTDADADAAFFPSA